ncbi:hypothetical protein GW782_00620 [bacterium]|nr:hypothetical protein [archaeon]
MKEQRYTCSQNGQRQTCIKTKMPLLLAKSQTFVWMPLHKGFTIFA